MSEPEKLTTPPPTESRDEQATVEALRRLEGGDDAGEVVERPEGDAWTDERQKRAQDGRFTARDKAVDGDGIPTGTERTERADAADDAGGEGVDEGEATAEEEAPDFWSAEDKEFWKQVPAEVRPLVKKYEQQRIEFANAKAEEAATARKQAEENARSATGKIEEAAQWWQQAAPQLANAFQSKWAWLGTEQGLKMARENPAEYTAYKAQADHEGALLMEANRRGQADIEAANKAAGDRLQQAKQETHKVLATKYTDYFGTPEKSKATYEKLGTFLHSKGIPVDRINMIHEAPILEIALDAMRFRDAQQKASVATSSGATANTGTAAPKKVTPGAPTRAANRGQDQIRQVRERFEKSGGNDMGAAQELIERLGL